MKTLITFDNEAEVRELLDGADLPEFDLESLLAEPQARCLVIDEPLPRQREWLWFMTWARHHCRGGRTRSERFADRRGLISDPDMHKDLHHRDSRVRTDAWANVGPFHKPIYPRGVPDFYPENGCRWCGASLKDKRADSVFCGQAHRRAFVRAGLVLDNGVGSADTRGKVRIELLPIDLAHVMRAEASGAKELDIRRRAYTNWCPECRSYQPQNHGQPCSA